MNREITVLWGELRTIINTLELEFRVLESEFNVMAAENDALKNELNHCRQENISLRSGV